MDVALILQNPELAFPDRHSRGRCRLPFGFAQGSKGISTFRPGTEPVPSGIVSMGWFPPGHRGIRESAQGHRSNQISSSQSSDVFTHRDYFLLQGPSPVGRSCRFYHFGSECVVRTFRDYGVLDHWTSSSGVHFTDRCGLVYGRLTTDGARNSGRISGGGL